MPDRAELVDLATRVAGWAGDGEQVEVYVSRGRDTELRVYDGDVEQLSTADAEGVGIRVVRDRREGFAYAGSLDEAVVHETLAEARDNAGFGTVDEHAGLAEPDGVPAAGVDAYDAELESFPTSGKIDLALDVERRLLSADPRIRALESVDYGDHRVEAAVATSTGISAAWRRTSSYLAAYTLAGEGDETQTGYGVTVGRRPSDLDAERVVRDAAHRATRMLGARKPPSAKFPVVLDPMVAAAFLSVLGDTLNGESVSKGRSIFADRVGEVVAAQIVTLVDDPSDPAALPASPYDAEGLASRSTPLIAGGVLQGFLYDSYAARRAATAPTASAVRSGFKSGPSTGARALRLAAGDTSPEAIIGSIDLGLYVQGVSGLHSGVNPVSGDFSVGAEGLMIRDGALAEPVREITIGSTIQRMLLDLLAVGDDLDWVTGRAAHVTLAVGDVSMSGR